jgi:hypothetical protein
MPVAEQQDPALPASTAQESCSTGEGELLEAAVALSERRGKRPEGFVNGDETRRKVSQSTIEGEDGHLR